MSVSTIPFSQPTRSLRLLFRHSQLLCGLHVLQVGLQQVLRQSSHGGAARLLAPGAAACRAAQGGWPALHQRQGGRLHAGAQRMNQGWEQLGE